MNTVTIIGGGLAGSEAAWQLAQRGVPVVLYEMKPHTFSPAHQEPHFAELVCSNSFGSQQTTTGSGLLQSELRGLGSFILCIADAHALPAGRALAVDRRTFSAAVTAALEAHPLVDIRREEVTELPETLPLILATGPLTGAGLAEDLKRRIGTEYLYFYDAVSPIVLGETIDRSIVFSASRYEDGPGDYLNCPFDKSQYDAFVAALMAGEAYPTHDFENMRLFHGCQPIEAIAATGPQTLAFGPMRPVGLIDPRTGTRPCAVLQLRREDRDGQLWNLVGFQTKLRHGEQGRIFRMIPGLEKAEFVRLGSIHRNTFVNAPALLDERLMFRDQPGVHVAGQISGVEGYLESSAGGLMAGLFVYGMVAGIRVPIPPPECMLGGLLRYLREAKPKNFQPMNANFGVLPPLPGRMPKKLRRQAVASRAEEAFNTWRISLPQSGRVVPGPEGVVECASPSRDRPAVGGDPPRPTSDGREARESYASPSS